MSNKSGGLFARFVRGFVDAGIDLEHPDERVMANVIERGKTAGLSNTESWQAYLTASELRSLHEQEILDGGSGRVAMGVNAEDLRGLRYGRKK